MPYDAAELDLSFRACRQVGRRSRSNFLLSFLLLPREKRRAMDALYAFMRTTDDLGDGDLPVEERRTALRAWRAALEEALAEGNAAGNPLSILPAVADTVRRFGIPAEHLHAVIDGQEMDLVTRRYESFAQLAGYCDKVAGAVGLACIHVWGFRGPEALAPARACGLAFQLTNILRDVQEDLAADRVYLPAEDMKTAGYTINDLRHGQVDGRFHRLMQCEIDRAREFYDQAERLDRWLHPDGRATFRLMHAVYRQLLEKIADRPGRVFEERVRLSRWEKAQIAARVLCRVWTERR